MSDIPPIHISAAQAGFQSREMGKVRDAARSAQTHTATTQLKTVNDAGGMVDTADADNQVFTDSEGAGSQGRTFEEAPPEDAPASTASTEGREGITRDGQGQVHVDLDA